jgi:hypothetical protein
MTTDEDAHIVADHVRRHLLKSGIPPDLMTPDDVTQILLECLDDFHEYDSYKARVVAEDVLTAWRNENAA